MPDNNNDDGQNEQQNDQLSPDELRSMDKQELVDIILTLRGKLQGATGESMQDNPLRLTNDERQEIETLAKRADALEHSGVDDGQAAEIRAEACSIAGVDDIGELEVI